MVDENVVVDIGDGNGGDMHVSGCDEDVGGRVGDGDNNGGHVGDVDADTGGVGNGDGDGGPVDESAGGGVGFADT